MTGTCIYILILLITLINATLCLSFLMKMLTSTAGPIFFGYLKLLNVFIWKNTNSFVHSVQCALAIYFRGSLFNYIVFPVYCVQYIYITCISFSMCFAMHILVVVKRFENTLISMFLVF